MASYSFLRLGLAIVALFLLLTQITAHLDLSADDLADYHLQIKRNSETLSNCLKSPGMQEHNARVLEYRNETLHELRKARGIDPSIGKSFQKSTSLPCTDNRRKSSGAAMRPGLVFRHQPREEARTIARPPGPVQLPLGSPAPLIDGLCPHSIFSLRTVLEGASAPALGRPCWPTWHLLAFGHAGHQHQDLPALARCASRHLARRLPQFMDGFLRGWQPTSYQGTVDFDTNFPGHYVGRTSHIHVSVRVDPSARYLNVGQVYFDQNVIDAVNVSSLCIAEA
jgi:hypothetical protein